MDSRFRGNDNPRQCRVGKTIKNPPRTHPSLILRRASRGGGCPPSEHFHEITSVKGCTCHNCSPYRAAAAMTLRLFSFGGAHHNLFSVLQMFV